MRPLKAMIFAAGFGTRLWPLTIDRAKAAIPFLNRPLVAHALDLLGECEIDQLIVNLHHNPESVQTAVRRHAPPGTTVQFSYEPEILGTGGALDKVRDQLQGSSFVAVNGKIVTRISLAAAIEAHRRLGALATLVLRPNAGLERYSQVEIDERGRITRFKGFPETDNTGSEKVPLMFTGIQILEPGIFDYIPRGRFSHTTVDAYPEAIRHGEMIAAHVATEPWYELSTLQRYLDTHLTFLTPGRESIIKGKHSIIESGAGVTDSVLWCNATIKSGASLHRCIVGDDVVVPSDSRFENKVIVPLRLCPQPERGEPSGENLIVPFT